MNTPLPEKSVVLRVRCENDECGMVSAWRFFADGSYRRVFDACCHGKRIPTLAQVEREMKLKGGTEK